MKKFLLKKILLSFCLISSIQAQIIMGSKTEIEPNNKVSEANLINLGDSLNSSIYPEGDIDYYKFSSNAGDTVVIFFDDRNNSQLSGYVEILDESNNSIVTKSFDYLEHPKWPVITYNSGNYFIRVGYYPGDFSYKINKDKKVNSDKIPALKTGDYFIGLKKFTPFAPVIDSLYLFDIYYNRCLVILNVFPFGLNTNVKLEYGKTNSYGSSIEFQDTIKELYPPSLPIQLTGLEPNTIYHIRAIAENDSGIFYYHDQLFSTPELPEFWEIKSFDSLWFQDLSGISFNHNTGFIVKGLNIFKTNDGGNTFLKQNSNNYLFGVFCIDSANVFLAGADGYIAKSTNAGLNWIQQNSNTSADLKNLFFTTINSGIAIGDKGVILNTTNSGLSWQSKNSNTNFNLNSLLFINKNTGWIVGDFGTILITTDEGKNWNAQKSNTSKTLTDIFFIDSTTGFIVSRVDGEILKTTNTGGNWISLKLSNNNLYGVSFIDRNNGLIVGSSGTIMLTSDGGTAWELQKSGTLNNLIRVTNTGFNWIAIGGFGTVLKSNYKLVSVTERNTIPISFNLNQNYPNPFNPTTRINFSIPFTSFVTLKVYDILGKEITTLINEEKRRGYYEITFNANNISSGVYFYKLQAGNYSEVKKFVLLR